MDFETWYMSLAKTTLEMAYEDYESWGGLMDEGAKERLKEMINLPFEDFIKVFHGYRLVIDGEWQSDFPPYMYDYSMVMFNDALQTYGNVDISAVKEWFENQEITEYHSVFYEPTEGWVSHTFAFKNKKDATVFKLCWG